MAPLERRDSIEGISQRMVLQVSQRLDVRRSEGPHGMDSEEWGEP